MKQQIKYPVKSLLLLLKQWRASFDSGVKPSEEASAMDDPETDKTFGWVLEMYAYAVVSALHGVQHILRKDFMLQVFLVDKNGNNLSRNGKIIGVDPSSDLAVLKVDVEGIEVKPVDIGSARKLNVGQSCYAIGNPYGYENTLTTGIVSGLGREIPSPNMGAIRGAI
ncbi:protease Do-like protein 5, chloroplastic [Tanacetum coccineum]